MLLPLLGLLANLASPPPDPFGMAVPGPIALITQTGAPGLLANSLALGAVVALGAVLLGGWLAWAEQRQRYPGRRVLAVLSLLPLATPSYILAGSVASATGPTGWLGGPLGLPRAAGLGAAMVVLTVVCAPVVQIMVGAALRRGSASEEEAARVLGAGPLRVFGQVVFPRLRPALALSAIISLLYAVSDFGAVAVLDSPVLTWRLYEAVRGQQLPHATLLGLAVLGATLPLFVLARLLHGSGPPPGVANPRNPAPHAPGPGALALTYLAHGLVIGIGVVLPVLTLAGWVHGGIARGLDFASPWQALGHTLLVAAVGALITGALAFAPAWIAARDPPGIGRPVEHATLLTSALPGVLLALGLVLAALGLSRQLGDGRQAYALLTGSGALLFAGYAVRFLAEGFAVLKASVLQLDPRQEASALALGAPPARWLGRIAAPALAPGLAATFLLLFVAILKELPVTLLLGGATGVRTLAFRVWDRYNEALWHDAGAAGLLLLGASLAVVLATLRWRR